VKDKLLDDCWWESIDLTIKTMDLIISLLWFTYIDQVILGDVYNVKISDPNPVSVSLIFQPMLNAQTLVL
jgi:hypothetical protein